MQSHISATLRWLVLVGMTYFSLLGHGAEDSFKGVLIQPKDGKLRVEINGQFFSEYHYQEVSRPFFYPVMGPDGLPMTRNWPMAQGEGEKAVRQAPQGMWPSCASAREQKEASSRHSTTSWQRTAPSSEAIFAP